MRRVANTLASMTSRRETRSGGPAAQVRMSGVTSTMPMASPENHVVQIVQSGISAAPRERARTVTPTVALTGVLAMAPSTTSANTSRKRSSDSRNPTDVSSHAAMSASRVFPPAMTIAGRGAMVPVRLRMNAPRVIPGQKRVPISSMAARATPDGGHTEETMGSIADTMKPSRPART